MTGGVGDITNLWWIAMAKANGLDPEKDVELLFSGATSARLAALVAGAVDATMLSTPQSFQAVQNGYADLGPVAPFLGEFPMMIWHVNEDWAKAHEKELLAFIRAHNKAVRYMSDPAHRQEVSQMLADASKSSLDDALKTWDVCMQVKAFVADGGISDSATERVRDTLLAIRRHQAPVAARNLCRSPLRQQGEVIDVREYGPEGIECPNAASLRARIRQGRPAAADDGRLDAPAFHRNHDAIAPVLTSFLQGRAGDVLEIGSGTGQHAVAFASRLPSIAWWPTDLNDNHLRSIDSLAQAREAATT